MGNRFSIPKGQIPPDKLEASLKILTARTSELIKERWGDFSVTTSSIQNNYEASGKGSEVLPKFLHNRISMRDKNGGGARVDIIYRHGDSENISISVDSNTAVEAASFYGAIFLAGVLGFCTPFFIPRLRVISDLMMLGFFLAWYIALQLPYFLLRMVMRARHRCLLEEVGTVVRESFVAEASMNPR